MLFRSTRTPHPRTRPAPIRTRLPRSRPRPPPSPPPHRPRPLPALDRPLITRKARARRPVGPARLRRARSRLFVHRRPSRVRQRSRDQTQADGPRLSARGGCRSTAYRSTRIRPARRADRVRGAPRRRARDGPCPVVAGNAYGTGIGVLDGRRAKRPRFSRPKADLVSNLLEQLDFSQTSPASGLA